MSQEWNSQIVHCLNGKCYQREKHFRQIRILTSNLNLIIDIYSLDLSFMETVKLTFLIEILQCGQKCISVDLGGFLMGELIRDLLISRRSTLIQLKMYFKVISFQIQYLQIRACRVLGKISPVKFLLVQAASIEYEVFGKFVYIKLSITRCSLNIVTDGHWILPDIFLGNAFSSP